MFVQAWCPDAWAAPSGKRTRKVLPVPGLLSRLIVPPWRSTIWAVM
jgi:hypothetical protein